MSPEELKKSRLSPRLIKTLRKKLKITQKELAILLGVTVGAAHQWETGKFTPKAEKKAALAALRKLGRTEVKKLLAQKASGIPERDGLTGGQDHEKIGKTIKDDVVHLRREMAKAKREWNARE